MSTNVNQIYKRTEVIGRGKFGIVYKGIHRTTKQIFAIKVLNLDTSEDEVKDVQQEIQFLSHLKQVPNVTHYYGSYLNGTKLWIIMDYCAGGSLRTLLKPGRLDEKYIGVIVREVLIALQYIHKQNVIHRDIKAANVLIANEGKVQLCDFGVAAQLTATAVRRNTMAGTPYWMAPEVIMEGTSYDVKADIWSLGITIYEIATGNPPYCDKEAIRAMQLITKSKPQRLEGKQFSPLLKEIVALCLDENPQERLSAEELLKSKFVKFHKSSPTTLLKEIISRYLIWREKKSSRESVLINPDDDVEENEIEVKWDFDSLSSNDYIYENEIDVNNINLNETSDTDYNNDGYDDGEDVFMTGYHNYRGHTGTFNFTNAHSTTTTGITATGTTNRNTGTYNVNVGSTLKSTGTTNRKEAPKSLLQLFEEPTEEEGQQDEDLPSHYELPKIPSTIGLHNLPTSNGLASSSRVSTPIREIEIPNFDDMEPTQTTEANKQRSRANTLLHTQSTTAIETRKPLDPLVQRRPTLTTSSTVMGTTNSTSTNGFAPGTSTIQSSQPPQFASTQQLNNLSHISNAPSVIARTTPSPKRELSQFNSPQKLQLITSSPNKNGSVSMRALHSPTNMSPLLQPLNTTNGNAINSAIQNASSALSNSTASTTAPTTTTSSSATTTGSKPPHIKRNYQNLRLQMPTPTTSFPKLLHSNSNIEEGDENVNQFGVNVSHVPMAMTPLTEKPMNLSTNASQQSINANHVQNNSQPPPASSSQIKRKLTNTMNQPPSMPFLSSNQRANSSVSSQSSFEGTNTTVNTSIDSRIVQPSLDMTLFVDVSGGDSKDKLNSEIIGLLEGFSNILGSMEESLIALNE